MTLLLRVVFDANVWVSAFLYRASVPGRAIALARTGSVQAIVSDALVEQVRGALPRLGFGPEGVVEAVLEMYTDSETVHPTTRLAVITAKESDNRVLECAVAGRADVIVTGDRKHLLKLGAYAGIPIVAPVEFLQSHES